MSNMETRLKWAQSFPCHECENGHLMEDGTTCPYCNGWGFYGPGHADLDSNGDPA